MCLGIPAKLESIDIFPDPVFRTGTILFGGIRRKISLAMLSEAKEGDYVLVHAGIALSIISAEEAQRVFEYLEEAGELDQG